MKDKKLELDQDGVIINYGMDVPGGLVFNGNLPKDFFDTFGSGKYCFNGAVIVDNPNYTPPE